METKNRSIDVEKLCKSMDNGSMCFEMFIQRVAGQWSIEQQSLLIDTILRDYKIPAIWITRTQTEQFEKNTVIDGNQRLHTIYDFVHDKFKLHKSIEPITITADNDNELDEDLTIELAGKKFSKLPKILQNIIMDYVIDEIQMFNYTDEQIEEQFYRLNNGALFTKSQKANVELGSDVAEKVQQVEQMDFWKRANFSKAQRKHAEITACILQCLMLTTGAEYSNFGANSVIEFANQYADNCHNSEIEEIKTLIETLDNCMPDDDENNKFLKKINIPALIMCTQTFITYKNEGKITEDQFTEFLNKWVDVDAECSGYMENCGQGSTGKAKVENRIKILNNWFISYVHQINSTEEVSTNAYDCAEENIGA